jgi:hypothetical protein
MKGIQNKNKIQVATSPGDCISIDQLESPTQGFIAQLKGRLTKKRYGAATIFVDHASCLSYVHFQQRISSDEMVEAKQAFEAYARSHGVTIKHYHADNGHFADHAFMQSVAKSGQTISFCRVKAHFQNGIAEKCIRDLSEQAHKQLLHAKARWPEAIEINLWPYVIHNANNIHSQHNCRQGGWKLTFGTILLNQHLSKTLTQSHLRLSSVCTTRSATGRKGNTKMEQASPTWNQPRSSATTCKLSQPSVEIGHRVSLTAISRPVQRLRDSQAFCRQ